jgi:hypothetical protein
MLYKPFTLPTEPIGKETAFYSIGFLTIEVLNGVETAICAGSGTLAMAGDVYGVLTAAHVLDALPKAGPVGLVVEIEDPSKYQRQTFLIENAECILIRGQSFNRLGPDLGFIRLPPDCIGWLKAQRSFYNLVKHRSDVLSNKEPSKSYIDTIIGMIHEMTEDVPSDKIGVRRQRFTAVFCGAKHVAMRYPADYDLWYFEPSSEIDFTVPGNFEGTSGGAVWRFFVKPEDNGTVSVLDRRIVAVPFYQTLRDDGKKELTCQGPREIYGHLLDKIQQRWPDEVKL